MKRTLPDKLLQVIPHLSQNLGTFLIITMVTVLVWFWAATETRDQRPLSFQLKFIPPAANPTLLVDPPFASVSVTLEGPRLALENAFNLSQKILEVPLDDITTPDPADPETPRSIILDLAKTLQKHNRILDMGVTVAQCQPPVLTLSLDEQQQVKLAINPRLPRNMRLEVLKIEPASAIVTMPRSLWKEHEGQLETTAIVHEDRLAPYGPGGPYHLDFSVELPSALPQHPNIKLLTPSVTITFRIQSQILEHTLDTVRVQIAGPPENAREFAVSLEPTTLEKVTVRGDSKLIQRIKDGEIVVAVVHLTYEDCENRIPSKPVSYFVSLDDDGIGHHIEATVQNHDSAPVIGLTITPLEENP